MNIFELDSHKLLTKKALEPLPEIDAMELRRIESLDVSRFSEEDVRAEIIDPILRIIGYRKGQEHSVDREKRIRYLGKKNKYIDYNLTLWEQNFWLVEAKKPMIGKSSFGYKELSQAVEYAIHPDINAALVVLCDGIKLEVFDREQNLVEPIFRIEIKRISEGFEKLRKLLAPLEVWFFYRRRIIAAIDRAFEHEGNQSRVNEFRNIIESRLQQMRSVILENFRKMKKSDDRQYAKHLEEASSDEIIDVHFFFAQPQANIDAMTSNLAHLCAGRGVSP